MFGLGQDKSGGSSTTSTKTTASSFMPTSTFSLTPPTASAPPSDTLPPTEVVGPVDSGTPTWLPIALIGGGTVLALGLAWVMMSPRKVAANKRKRGRRR